MSSPEQDGADSAPPDFALDPSDPLYMLLNNTHDSKQDHPLGFSFPMDLEFSDPSFSVFVDPNALFIDGKESIHSAPAVPFQPQDLLNPFYFSSPTLSSASASADESLSGFSPPSPGSSSGSRASPPAPAVQGLSAAVSNTTTAFLSQNNGQFATPFQTYPVVQQLLPPVSSLPPPVHTAHGPQTHVINTAVTGRPKTSHTTIERRYRTNLNARIQSLKAAVPALRVLDQNYKSDEYKVDDRGYVDGVKVARKGSKANVLGKAVEYIRVLKRREVRLKREQDGLRTLICGFPGGQNVLTEWETEWTKKFGGPEKDEIEGTDDASDDEDGDGEDDGDTSERVRKKPKTEPLKKERRRVAPAVPILPAPGNEVPVIAPSVVEKRKRGRPRKIQPNIPAPIAPAAPAVLTNTDQQGIVIPPATSQVTQPQQYLLAVFALFSFFNSPLTSASQPVAHHHTHEGSVLPHATSSTFVARPATGWMWNDLIQIIHLLASLAVLVSIVVPWVPVPRKVYRSRVMQLIPFASIVCQAYTAPSRELSDHPAPPDPPDVGKGSRGAADEFDNLVSALNIGTGWIGLARGSLGAFQVQGRFEPRRERRAWTRLAELIVLSSEEASVSVRWQVYNHLSHLAKSETEAASGTLVSDLCTVALFVRSLPFTESRSQALWARASRLAEAVEIPAYQRLVLNSMTAEEATEYLATSKSIPGSTPIALLASGLLRKRLHSHVSSFFVECVSQDQENNSCDEFPSADDSKAWSATLSYGRSLGGDIGLLSDAFANVWQGRWFSLDISDVRVDAANEGVLALLRTIVLYRKVFASQSTLSLPSNLLSKTGAKESEADVVLRLRRALGSSVFEESGESRPGSGPSLEDARDRVVDMIVNLQREQRSWAS